MEYLATAHQMQTIDQYLIENKNYTILELIDLAAKQLYLRLSHFKRPLILCGPGNNGADGLALAKLFKQDQKEVHTKLFYFEKANAQVKTLLDPTLVVEDVDLSQYDVIVDGIFGNGLDYPIEKTLQQFIYHVNNSSAYKVSIDIPTNINADLGILGDEAFKADLTITFMCYKKAMLNLNLQTYFGKIDLAHFGIEQNVLHLLNLAKLVDKDYITSIIKKRHYDDYKGTYGTVLHLTGSKNYTGASVLAAKGSIYSGSGIVKVVSDQEVIEAIQTHCIEAVVDTLSITDFENYQAILIGCGKGRSRQTYQLLKDVLTKSRVPIVIDADGLNVLSENLELLKQKQCPVILTPHIGELHRLMPECNDFIEAAKKLALDYQVICLVKGPHTFISDGTAHFYNTTGNPAMASAGMGDVLAGMICSFCGQGYLSMQATVLGVYLHGLCADQLAQNQYTVLAHQLIEQIPFIMKTLIK